MLTLICETIGISIIALLLVLITIKILKIIWKLFAANAFGYGVKWCGRLTPTKTWAVITGSTDGIGLAYAQEMADKGYSLLLISRNSVKLSKVKDYIKSNHKNCPEIRVLAVDFSRTDIYEEIENELNLLEDIHVLINNIGITYNIPEYFTEIPHAIELINTSINCNIISCTRLINLILPKMEKRGSGVIINISSYTALFPTPLLAIYSATKAYVDYLSRALQVEYEDKGIIIQSVLPFYVSTNMTKNIRTSLIIPSPKCFVKSALKTVGIESRTNGYLSHKMIAFVQNSISYIFGSELNMSFAFNHFREVRRRFYANQDLSAFGLKLLIPLKV